MIMAFRLPMTFALVRAFAAAAFGQRRVITLQPVDVAGSIAQMGPRQHRGQRRQRSDLDLEAAARHDQDQDHRHPPNPKC